jgi:hypothetical protein
MSALQRFIVSIVPEKWARSMEAESRQWMIRCACGHARSVWEMGGIRWKGGGRPSTYLRCPQCGQRSWHRVEKAAAADAGGAKEYPRAVDK